MPSKRSVTLQMAALFHTEDRFTHQASRQSGLWDRYQCAVGQTQGTLITFTLNNQVKQIPAEMQKHKVSITGQIDE